MISEMLRFPFSMLDEDIEKLFYQDSFQSRGRYGRGNYPAINIGATDKSVKVYMFIPGIKTEDLDVVIEKNMLSVSGERVLPEADERKGATYRRERFSGPFKRTITLPDSVDADTAEAIYKNGVLHISIAKHVESEPRQIKISVQ